MIVFAAFTPHTPLLVPGVGKDSQKALADSVRAMSRLADELYAARPDTIVVISAHATQHADAFSANPHDAYAVDLRAFGDLATSRTFAPNLPLIDAIQRGVRSRGIPFTLDSEEALDYGSAVPLLLLTEALPSVRVVPVSWSGKSPKEHVEFGRALKDVLLASAERVAVVASGDLSHALTSDAPAGFRPEGAAFDETVRQSIEQLAVSRLLAMDETAVERAAECALRPLLVLFGVLDRMHVTPEILSEEAPFGVGYLVAQFHFSA